MYRVHSPTYKGLNNNNVHNLGLPGFQNKKKWRNWGSIYNFSPIIMICNKKSKLVLLLCNKKNIYVINRY